MESYLSGYCRTIDESRMVCAVKEDGKLLEADCSYVCCPFTKECTVAQKISAFITEA